MNWTTYDLEVFRYDWVAVLKKSNGDFEFFHNDPISFRDRMMMDDIFIGFNTKEYDQHIVRAITAGFSNEEVKLVNDYIINGGNGWQCPLLRQVRFDFCNVDIRDDMQKGLSLKSIEGHFGMDIEESEVDFDIDRPLTEDELQQTFFYCKHDVSATEELIKKRMAYLETKGNLAVRAGLDYRIGLKSTNAKLTALMLKAKKQEWHDGRDYRFPQNLDLGIIPQEILDFFKTIHDDSISEEELFETNLNITLGGMECTFAWGGAHGSLSGYHEKSTASRVIQNRDVSSLYPSLIEGYHYLSRNVPDPEIYYQIRRDRIQAKHDGDKQTANDLKLPLNTVSGAQENRYNDLYDPLPTRSMRISGQLFITDLTMHLLRECPSIKLLNLNTDGIAYSIDKADLPNAEKVCDEWQKRTGFELETDDIERIWLKDVNNLLIVMDSGKIKKVGGYLNYGITNKGAWAINNNSTIVKDAIVEYFINGIPPEETIGSCEDVLKFQTIANAGSKYREAFYMVNGEKKPVQKVNRIYATTDSHFGKIYKVKAETSSEEKIASLPEHCIIDNNNQITIDQIDKQYYVDITYKKINDFNGISRKKGKKKMSETKPKYPETNVYHRLMVAREKFLAEGIKKSGKNMTMKYMFFELADIVPLAQKVLGEVGLLAFDSFSDTEAKMKVLCVDEPESAIIFQVPFIYNMELKIMNPVQQMGAAITYYRRYLYMLALDIIESDDIDNGVGQGKNESSVKTQSDTTPETAPAKTYTKTAEQLTSPSENADSAQITALKNRLKELIAKDPMKTKYVQQIAVETGNFQNVSRIRCEEINKEVSEMMKG